MANMEGWSPLSGQPRRWDILAAILQQGEYRSFVEVGCKEGRTTGHILKTCPNVLVTAIDPWCEQPEQIAVEKGEDYGKWDFAKIEAEFWKNVGEHKDRVTMLRCCSREASAIPAGQSVDVVFIDAAHDYESVCQDIDAWLPKVHPGGVLCGHDFQHKFPTVERAVADRFNLVDIGVAPDSVWFYLVK